MQVKVEIVLFKNVGIIVMMLLNMLGS